MEKKLSIRFLNIAIIAILINICTNFLHSLLTIDPELFNFGMKDKSMLIIISSVITFPLTIIFIIYLKKKRFHFPLIMMIACFICGPIVTYLTYQAEFHGNYSTEAGSFYLFYCLVIMISGISFIVSSARKRVYLKFYGIMMIVFTLSSFAGVFLLLFSRNMYGAELIKYAGLIGSLDAILLILNYHSEKFPDENLKLNDEIVDAD